MWHRQHGGGRSGGARPADESCSVFPPYSGPGCLLFCSPRGLGPHSGCSAGRYAGSAAGPDHPSVPGMSQASRLSMVSATAWRTSPTQQAREKPRVITNSQIRCLRRSWSRWASLPQPPASPPRGPSRNATCRADCRRLQHGDTQDLRIARPSSCFGVQGSRCSTTQFPIPSDIRRSA